MAIRIKAVERNVSFDKNMKKYAFVMQPEIYSKLSAAKVIQEAALRSGISRGAINAAWDALAEVIKAWATEGHSVAIPGLGTMRFGLRSTSVSNVNDVAAGLITTRRVIFTPSVEIKDELAKTSIGITCFDRNGNLLKRVTSVDDGTVEDPDNDPNGGGTGDGGNGNPGGGNPGGSGNENPGSGNPGGGGNENAGGSTSGGGSNPGSPDDDSPFHP